MLSTENWSLQGFPDKRWLIHNHDYQLASGPLAAAVGKISISCIWCFRLSIDLSFSMFYTHTHIDSGCLANGLDSTQMRFSCSTYLCQHGFFNLKVSDNTRFHHGTVIRSIIYTTTRCLMLFCSMIYYIVHVYTLLVITCSSHRHTVKTLSLDWWIHQAGLTARPK